MVKRIAINEFSTARWSFFQDVLQYSSLGINQIGLWRAKVEDFGEEAAIHLLYEMKMSASSVHWIGGFTGSDGKSFNDSIDDGLDAILLASRTNAECVILHPGSRNGHTKRHSNRLVETAIQKLGPVAEDFGVRLAIEPMPTTNGPWSFQSFDEVLDLVDKFPAHQLGITLDLYHVGLDESVLKRLPEFADRICLVQLADRDRNSALKSIDSSVSGYRTAVTKPDLRDRRKQLGEGMIDIDRWLTSLSRCGYQGAFEAELHGTHFDNSDYLKTLDHLCSFMDSKSELVETVNRIN